MRYAVISDIHGRREAMLQALDLARDHGAERLVFLGDYVGYMGSDPIGVVETAMFLEQEGAICLRGNHDQALVEIVGGGDTPEFGVMNVLAQQGIVRDASFLDSNHLEWLAARPYTESLGQVVFAHGAVPEPEAFRYPTSARTDVLFEPRTFFHVSDIALELESKSARILCHGHTHRPMIIFPDPLHQENARQIVPGESGYDLPRRGSAVIDVGSAGAIRTSGPQSLVLLDQNAPAGQIQYLRF